METTALDPMIGRMVDDRYEVTARIARGGMATVYRAVDRRLERTVAVKVMHPHLAESADFVARFRREARAAARLSHPGIVAVHDQGIAGEASYLTMELVDGPNLRTLLRERGSLPLGEALDIVDRVLDALASAHRAGVVHRDIKPENVLIAPGGRPKLADFGLARAVSETTAATTGTVLGTVAYLAPEIVTDGRADPRSDVYAVGVLLYELITGSQPFVGEAPIQVAFLHVNSSVPAPSVRVPWLPVEVDELVAALAARDPDERPWDAGAARALLRRTVAALDAATLARRADVAPPVAESGTEQGAGPGAASPADADATRATEVRHGTVALPIGAIQRDLTAAAPAAPGRRWWPRALVALLVLAVVAGAGTLWWFQVGPGGAVAVPALVGRSEDDAVAALREAELVPQVSRTNDDTVPEGAVIAVDPAAGTQVRKGDEVAVSVSLGILMLDVPDVAGAGLDAAKAALTGHGLPLGDVKEEFHDTVPAGTVLATAPAAGEVVPHTTPVALVVSAGRQPVDLPDVVGRSREDAVAALSAAGLGTGAVTEEFSDTVAKGTVIAQAPAVGSAQVFKGDAVALVVSRGPDLVAVPDVVGSQVAPARQALEAAGFRVEVDEVLGGFFGTVRAQDQAAGAMLPRGTVVTLTVV
ncbi:Stk1 family PASTA domain-containing Ser/Thr kinase [Georgenia sp. SYP-B2076]|uniref:Stk1 family PASTA domain-containing Ser/Thr kinase n=1 Tax=Georgenia sp. SYP-B2076 TaxID=2495881 RepID=UPI001F0BB0CB|nr:Stk1 family PASTA domain-containing Ser/Thr kinase [Georgenia sp. SYP-B2076]